MFALGATAEAGTVHIRYPANEPEKLATANVKLYQNLVTVRDSNPTKFDKSHPFYGRLLTDPSFANALVHRWESHEQRFEYWHPYLWRILDGISQQPQSITPPPTSIDKPPSDQSGGGGGGGGNTPSVPEPSSWLLMLIGFGFLGRTAVRFRPGQT
jgi:hypothetical protein